MNGEILSIETTENIERLKRDKNLLVLENANLNDIVTVSKKAAGTGGSRLGLKNGDKISINNLLYGLLMVSRK